MSPDIETEARLLCLSIAVGLGLAAVYGVLRLFRWLAPHGWFWVGIEDFIYWVFSGFAVFYLLYRENDGALRLYVVGSVLASMALGGRLCRAILQKVLKKAGGCFRIKPTRNRRR